MSNRNRDNEPKVGESIFNQNGEYITDIEAIISHHPFKVFGRDGNKYIIRQLYSGTKSPRNIVIEKL